MLAILAIRASLSEIDLLHPLGHLGERDAGVPVAGGPHGHAHRDPTPWVGPAPQVGIGRGGIAAGDPHEPGRRGHVGSGYHPRFHEAIEFPRSPSGQVWRSSRFHDRTPASFPANSPLSRHQSSGGGCQMNTP